MATTNAERTGIDHREPSLTWQLRPSEYLATMDLGEGEYIVWNRFHPVPTLLSEGALGILHGDIEGYSAEELEQCRTMFLDKKLAYEGDEDPSKQRFLEKIGAFKEQLHEHDDSPQPYYKSLEISNDPCNVSCTYCMIPAFKQGAEQLVQLGRKPPPARSKMSKDEKLEVLKRVLDQHIRARLAAGLQSVVIGMSGGEVLAQWPILKGMIEYAAERYPDIEISWTINSSLTILTKEKAEFLARHKVKVHTSIDGYKENHDKYRPYHNGKGSFDDVRKGLALYNEHNPDLAITAFQGTIAKADEFDGNKMFEFAAGQFEAARMAPNLLGVSEEDGAKQADLMMDLKLAGDKLGFEFGDPIFRHMTKHIESKGTSAFSLYCKAMTNAEARTHIGINISTMNASRSCSFIPSANIPLEDVDGDIFSPAIWGQNLQFALERAETIQKHCLSCDIAGICHGSCVLNGIDANNQINPAGCAYLRRLWQRIVAHLLHRGDRIQSRTAHPIRLDEAAATACVSQPIETESRGTEPIS